MRNKAMRYSTVPVDINSAIIDMKIEEEDNRIEDYDYCDYDFENYRDGYRNYLDWTNKREIEEGTRRKSPEVVSIKELYDMAKEIGAEDFNVMVSYDCDDGYYSFYKAAKEIRFDKAKKRVTIEINQYNW